MFKKIIAIVFILIASPFVVSLFVPTDYHAEQSITISKPVPEVFDYIKYLKNQDNFSKWASIDPKMEKSYRGEDGTAGFVSAWKSDHPEVGHGEQEIIKITPLERIDYELRFLKPFEATEPAYMTTKLSEKGTIVTWGFHGHMDYPMNLIMLFIDFETVIEKDLETGLINLKTLLEEQ